jgi:Na+-translocating membrane potential-generating system (MpsC)
VGTRSRPQGNTRWRYAFGCSDVAVWFSRPSSSRAAGTQKDGKRNDQMSEMQAPRIAHAGRQGLELQKLTNSMVRLYKELFGRGPTKARTNYAGPDTLVATIENSLTPAERSMLDLGEHQRVREIRMFFQHASDTEFKGRWRRSRAARCELS